jgi:hypothetical protein
MGKIIKRKTVFPDIESVKKGIDFILAKNLDEFKYSNDPKEYFKELDSFFLSNLGLLPYGFVKSSGDKMSVKCFRLRAWKKDFNPDLIIEHSHPPPAIVTKIQRANLPRHPVFYASPDIKTSIIETFQGEFDQSQTNEYFISQWAFRPEESFTVVPFLYGNTSEKNIFKHLGNSALSNFKLQFQELSKENIQVLKTILSFLANLFVYENTHVISSYLAHSYIYAPHNHRADVFIYPSVQAGKHTVNFAIHPNTVTHKMVLEKIYLLHVSRFETTSKNNDEISYTINFGLLKVGINKDGVIGWQDPNDELDKEFSNFFEGATKTEIN